MQSANQIKFEKLDLFQGTVFVWENSPILGWSGALNLWIDKIGRIFCKNANKIFHILNSGNFKTDLFLVKQGFK